MIIIIFDNSLGWTLNGPILNQLCAFLATLPHKVRPNNNPTIIKIAKFIRCRYLLVGKAIINIKGIIPTPKNIACLIK